MSLYDFENREKLFDIDSRYKFCLLTAGQQQIKPREVSGGFYLTRLDHLLDPNRIYKLETATLQNLIQTLRHVLFLEQVKTLY